MNFDLFLKYHHNKEQIKCKQNNNKKSSYFFSEDRHKHFHQSSFSLDCKPRCEPLELHNQSNKPIRGNQITIYNYTDMNSAFKRASFPIIDLLNNPRSVKFTSNRRNKHLDQVRSEVKNKNKFTTKSKKATHSTSCDIGNLRSEKERLFIPRT